MLVAGVLVFGGSREVRAANLLFYVNSVQDAHRADGPARAACESRLGSGVCTIRSAFEEAALHPVADQFTVQLPAATFALGLGELPIAHRGVVWQGAGAGLSVVDGQGSGRVLGVAVGATAFVADIGLRSGRADTGGGIQNAGALTLLRAAVSGNQAAGGGGDGGGIQNLATGSLTLQSGTVVSGNSATGRGGGIHNLGRLEIRQAAISGNRSAGPGGGLFDVGSAGQLTETTFSGNEAAGPGAAGGGVYEAEGSPAPAMLGVALVGNTAAGPGGGLFAGAALTMTNLTVSGNRAGQGGGVELDTAATVTNLTISANLAASGAGGLVAGNGFPGERIDVANTIVAANSGGDCGVKPSSPGQLTSSGHNLAGDATCPFAAAGDRLGVDSGLGPLAYNGGRTQTMALEPGSPAIDGGGAPCPDSDQRGVRRPQGAACDVGAYELIPGGQLTPITPYRVYDTRQAAPIGPNSSIEVPVAGIGPVPPSGVGAVVVNITVTNPTDFSYVTVYPSGSGTRPLASNVNFAPGQTVANLAEVPLSPGGHLSVYNAQGTADVVLDVQGYVSAGVQPTRAGLYNPLDTPRRVYDSRASGQRLGPGGVATIGIAGGFGVPPSAGAVVVNVTAVNGSESSYLTAYPAGAGTRPEASTVNFAAGRNVPNRVTVGLGAGSVAIYNSQGTVDLVVDVAGYFTGAGLPGATGYLFHPLTPVRVADTRVTGTPLFGGEVRGFPVEGQGGVLAAAAAVLNVTAVAPSTASFLTVFPGGSALPPTSDLNFAPSQTVPNLAVARLGIDGSVNLYNDLGLVHAVLDATGYYS